MMRINKNKVLKCLIYVVSMFFWTSIALGLMKDDNTSFWVKISHSPSFALKFVILEIAILTGTILCDFVIYKKSLIEIIDKLWN